MPKGALLHAHLDATVNATYLLHLALQHPTIHVRASIPITASTISSTVPEFVALPRDQFPAVDGPGLTDSAYKAGDWVGISKARVGWNVELGGPQGFDKWVIGALTINPDEAYNTHNTIAKVGPHLCKMGWYP